MLHRQSLRSREETTVPTAAIPTNLDQPHRYDTL